MVNCSGKIFKLPLIKKYLFQYHLLFVQKQATEELVLSSVILNKIVISLNGSGVKNIVRVLPEIVQYKIKPASAP
jgi:hypothetical protein